MARNSKAASVDWHPQDDGGVAVEDPVEQVLADLKAIPEVAPSIDVYSEADRTRTRREILQRDIASEKRQRYPRADEIKRLEAALADTKDPAPFNAAARREYLIAISAHEGNLRAFMANHDEYARLVDAKHRGELSSFEGERLRELQERRDQASRWLHRIAAGRGELPALVPSAVTTRENALRAAASALVGIGGLSKQNMATIEALKADVARQLQGIAEAVLTKPYAELAACVEQ